MSEMRILCNSPTEHLQEVRKILESIGRVDYREYGYRKLLESIGNYDILIPSLRVMHDENLLRKAKRLKIIATPSTGIDHIDVEFAKRQNIKVISLRGEYEFLENVTATAEHSFALLLSLLRQVPFAFDDVKRGGWRSPSFRGRELKDKVLGIIGYGRLGEMVAKRASAFQMKVLAYDPYKKIRDSWVKQVGLKTLLKSSDIISIHVPLNTETKGMISKREFTTMRKGVYIINTSRGAVMDEKCLYEALSRGDVGGAALDVLTDELKGKIEDNPLVKYARTHKNLIITPHLGGVTVESQNKAYTFMAKKLWRLVRDREGNLPRKLPEDITPKAIVLTKKDEKRYSTRVRRLKEKGTYVQD